MTDETVVSTLNSLISLCKDGEADFFACARHAQSPELRQILTVRAVECQTAARDLAPFVVEYGGDPQLDGSPAGALQRAWRALRASLLGTTDRGILDECERAEEAALLRYQDALVRHDLPVTARLVVARQRLSTQRGFDELRMLKERLTATA
jgi:uncharacterized protein (TIGR02284 family)